MKIYIKDLLSKILFRLYFAFPRKLNKLIVFFILKMEGGPMYSTTIRKIYKEKGIEIGYGTYGGCFSSSIPSNVSFGNYCSVAQNIRIFRANHPKDLFTTHPILYNPVAGYVKNDKLVRPHLKIGHDVWIGEWSIILPSVSFIGNGAIIGAGSVVTKNVVPYTIVAGNPAKIIGLRFNNDVIEKLEKSQWWDLSKNELILRINEFREILNTRRK
ncbi:CatB-related O-acetyltransferase [Parabacteroides sp. Marseille-P3160]|uniref:CatB-related O-acetyltransferase n=1 Tax=Parabacteroides sp. Marseille-P3160 TaxID=1917887 RepID=UPI0009BC217C|nr:CatB-related O-acetyltransferase [Parabacteroides sp. Marseille-P3160]